MLDRGCTHFVELRHREVRILGILRSSLSAYRASTGLGYPSGCPGLYNACIVGRVVTHFSTHTTRPSLYAPTTLRGTVGSATMSIPGAAGTSPRNYHPSQCARRTGFYRGVGAPTLLSLRGSGLYTVLGRAISIYPTFFAFGAAFALPRAYGASAFILTLAALYSIPLVARP